MSLRRPLVVYLRFSRCQPVAEFDQTMSDRVVTQKLIINKIQIKHHAPLGSYTSYQPPNRLPLLRQRFDLVQHRKCFVYNR